MHGQMNQLTLNIALLQVLIVVVDVQDTPPVFIGLPNIVRISENTKIVRFYIE